MTRFSAAATLLLLACSGFVSPVVAQQRPAERPPVAEIEALTRMDAEATREELMQIIERHPPAVGRVLKLDPSLMRNEAYLAAYPALRDFLARHPEIPQNSPYYFERVQGVGEWRPREPKMELIAAVLGGTAGFIAFTIILSTLIWLIRTVLDHRRWNRLSKIQAEVHTKLMDRFSTNEELLTYVQTPSGRRFLEAGPSPLAEPGPALGAPVTRILWSVQIGAVLLVAGLGLWFLSTRATPEVQEVFFVFGCLAGALGAGFLVSAVAAYGLSRRLGLLDRPVQSNA